MANDGAAKTKKGSRSGHHRSSSAIDQHLEVAVEEAEKSLLQGQFRQALKDANRCLVYATTNLVAADGKGDRWTTQTSDGDSEVDEDGLCVRAPFYFPFVFDNVPHHDDDDRRQPRTLCIRIDARPSDHLDRAAAVALQSWYELSQRISENSPVVQESHLRLLQPFWRAYATFDEDRTGPARLSPRSCSLELVVVLVQFCRATYHVREAVELALATLNHVLSSEDAHQLLASQWHHLEELLVYLFCRLLPYSVHERSVELALARLSAPVPCEAYEEGRNQRLEADGWLLTDQTNATAIRILMRFLENAPVHWPEECQGPLEVCREQLEAELEKHPPDHRDDISSFHASTSAGHPLNTTLSVALPAVPVNGIRNAASGQFEGLPTLGWDLDGAKLWLCRLSYLAKVTVVEPFALSPQRWSNRGVLAVSLWAFWSAWRRRAKFYRISKLALRAVLLQPIRDIVEALTSTSTTPPTRR